MRGYANVYFTIQTDERTASIWQDDALLGLWTRLLVLAEQAWPEPAYLPRSVNRRRLATLTDAGCIEVVDKDRYRFHGLDSERARRSAHGKAAADARWNAEGNAPSIAHPLLTRAGAVLPPSTSPSSSTSPIQENSTAVPAREDDADGVVLAWLSSHRAGIPEGGGLHLRLIDLVGRHGLDRVLLAMERIKPGSTARQYILGAENALDKIETPDLSDLNRAEREDEERRVFQSRLARTRALVTELRGEPA